MFIYFMAIGDIWWMFGIFYDHLVNFVFICDIYSGFGIMYQEKSGNPVRHRILHTDITYNMMRKKLDIHMLARFVELSINFYFKYSKNHYYIYIYIFMQAPFCNFRTNCPK
jgi:hypothetical protein